MPDPSPRRVLISYAHESPEHMADVERLYKLLRGNGVDAQLDLVAAEEPVDWVLWMTREIREADHVLMIISPSYKRGFESDEPAEHGAGVGWEARIIRDEIYRDQASARRKFLTVLLPGGRREDIPDVLQPGAGSRYHVGDFTVTGAETLIRWLTRQPAHVAPKLGAIPHLPPVRLVEAEATPAVVLQLVVTDEDSHSGEEIVNALTKAVAKSAESVQPQRFSDGRLAGAVVLISAERAAGVIEVGIRAVYQHVRAALKSAPSLEARIGLDLKSSPPSSHESSHEQVTVRLVQGRTTRAMHAVDGAHLVIAASPTFHRWAVDAKVGFPAASPDRSLSSYVMRR